VRQLAQIRSNISIPYCSATALSQRRFVFVVNRLKIRTVEHQSRRLIALAWFSAEIMS
jgi:hypothetical protein